MWELDGRKSYEFKDQTKEEYRREKQKEHNDNQKRIAKTIGENFAAYSLIAIMMLMIGSIWSEVGIFSNWRKFIGDALVTIVLYILADVCASYIGTQTGKLDDDYIRNHEEYLSLRKDVRQAGTLLMNVFCDWQIDVEYEFYLRKKCKDFKIDYKEYMANYHGKTLEELQELFPIEQVKDQSAKKKVFGTIKNVKTTSKAAKVFQLNQIEHIELTPDILMTDGMVRNKRGDVGISGEEYVEQHTVGKGHIALTALVAIIAAVPTFELVQEFTVGALIYTIFKIALLLFRMYSGFSRGSRAFNGIEISHLSAKTKYLNYYLEFLDKKIYKRLGDRYTVIGDDDDQAGWEAQVDESGAGGHS
jgi:hypothetical protein